MLNSIPSDNPHYIASLRLNNYMNFNQHYALRFSIQAYS